MEYKFKSQDKTITVEALKYFIDAMPNSKTK